MTEDIRAGRLLDPGELMETTEALIEQVAKAQHAATSGKETLLPPKWLREDWMRRVRAAIGNLSAPLQPETTTRQLGDFLQLTEEADRCWRCPATEELRDPKTGEITGMVNCPLGGYYLRLHEVYDIIRYGEDSPTQIAVFHKTRCPGMRQRRAVLASRRRQEGLLRGLPFGGREVDEPTPFDNQTQTRGE